MVARTRHAVSEQVASEEAFLNKSEQVQEYRVTCSSFLGGVKRLQVLSFFLVFTTWTTYFTTQGFAFTTA